MKRTVLIAAAVLALGALIVVPNAGADTNATQVAPDPAPAALDAASAAAAIGEEYNTGKAGNPPAFGAGDCRVEGWGTACLHRYGDVIWIKDSRGDGFSAEADWENYLWDGSAWRLYRRGRCVNNLKAGHWAYCNKDFYEDQSINIYGTKGSGLRIDACEIACVEGYTWVRNNE